MLACHCQPGPTVTSRIGELGKAAGSAWGALGGVCPGSLIVSPESYYSRAGGGAASACTDIAPNGDRILARGASGMSLHIQA